MNYFKMMGMDVNLPTRGLMTAQIGNHHPGDTILGLSEHNGVLTQEGRGFMTVSGTVM